MEDTYASPQMGNIKDSPEKYGKKWRIIIVALLITCAIAISAVIIILALPKNQDSSVASTAESSQDETSISARMMSIYRKINDYQSGLSDTEDISYLESEIKSCIDEAKKLYGVQSDTYINANILFAKYLFATNQPNEAISYLNNQANSSGSAAKYYYYVEILNYYKSQDNTDKQLEYVGLILSLPDDLDLFGESWSETKPYYQELAEELNEGN